MTARLTDEEIAAALAVCEEATPGPWRVMRDGLGNDCGVDVVGNHDHPGPFDTRQHVECPTCRHIAAARTLLPRALRELQEARHELAATKRAKAENDDRFMCERDEARRERDEALALRDIALRAAHPDGIAKLMKLIAERNEARAEVAKLRRHYDASGPEHNLLELLELYHEREQEARALAASAQAQAEALSAEGYLTRGQQEEVAAMQRELDCLRAMTTCVACGISIPRFNDDWTCPGCVLAKENERLKEELAVLHTAEFGVPNMPEQVDAMREVVEAARRNVAGSKAYRDGCDCLDCSLRAALARLDSLTEGGAR